MSERKLFTPEETEAKHTEVKKWVQKRITQWMGLLSDDQRLEVIRQYCWGCGTIQSMHPNGSCVCQRDE